MKYSSKMWLAAMSFGVGFSSVAMANGGGPLTITYEDGGRTAVINGLIASDIKAKIKSGVTDRTNPAVTKIVLMQMDGSSDDVENEKAIRLLRSKRIDTEVRANSRIASGAVDMFLSGVNRTVNHGARLGVHSWAGGNTQGSDLIDDRANNQHKSYLDLIAHFDTTSRAGDPDTVSANFYWDSLKAMPGCDVKNLTETQMRRLNVSTNYVGGAGAENALEAAIDQMVVGETEKLCNGIADSYTRRHVIVPEGVASMTIQIAELDEASGDAELYVSDNGQPATSQNNVCDGSREGNSDRCVIANPSAGRYDIGLQAGNDEAYSNISLGVYFGNAPDNGFNDNEEGNGEGNGNDDCELFGDCGAEEGDDF